MYNWEFDGASTPKKVVPSKKKVVKKKATNATEGAMDTVEGDDNIIYFYASVAQKENFKLNQQISSIGRQMEMVSVKLGMDIPPPIHLRINSYGGSVFAAFGSIDIVNLSVCVGVVETPRRAKEEHFN